MTFEQLFLSKDERDLYQLIRYALLKSASSFLKIQWALILIGFLLFYGILSIKLHLSFAVLMVTILLLFHVVETSVNKRWGELGVFYLGLFFIALVAIFWGTYSYVVILISPAHLSLALFFLAAIGTYIFTLMGFFSRIIALLIVIESVMLILAFLTLFGRIEWQYVQQVLLICVVQLSVLMIQNRRLIAIMQVKQRRLTLLSELTEKNNELEEANRNQSRYLSAASHDLRQPLHAIALIANEVQRKNKLPALSPIIGRLEFEIERLSQFFDAMLYLSRLDAGVIKPKFGAVSMQALFDKLSNDLRGSQPMREVRLTFRPSQAWVYSDEVLLYMITRNLVINALRYTQSGGVLVGTRQVKGEIKLVVYDTGVGIAPNVAPKIIGDSPYFDRAEQVVVGGVGVNLAISARVCQLLQSKLVARSRVGHGTMFGLYLHRTVSRGGTVSASPTTELTDYLQGKKVVILDDDPQITDSLENLLASWGMEVSVALSSEMLAEIIEDEKGVDMVISDYHLGLDYETGLDVLHRARELQEKSPPVCILMTGDTTTDLQLQTQALGIAQLFKPLRPARLRSQLNDLLRSGVSDSVVH